jgi:SAM-dependent methyltransferase
MSAPTMGPWPKKIPELTVEQARISNDWMKHWLDEQMTKKAYLRLVDNFNQRYPLRSVRPGARTLELGAGVGTHCEWENLTNQEYYCNELRGELAKKIRERFPPARTAIGDCQERLDFPDQFFDRVIAIHVLEHLPNLPGALAEVHRLLKPTGQFSVVIPCEGGFGYQLARRVSSQRMFEKRYHWSYHDYIRTEHVNTAIEVIALLEEKFVVKHRTFFPSLIPVIDLNLVIGLTLQRKP